MATASTIYCVGCGSDITNRPADRRDLDNPRYQQVVQVFAFLEGRGHLVEDVDNNVSGGGRQTSYKMCRKCFSSYERYSKLHNTIQENLRRTTKVLQIFPLSLIAQPLAKRPRLGGTPSQLTYRGQQSSSGVAEDEPTQAGSDGTTESPQVAVSLISNVQTTYLL